MSNRGGKKSKQYKTLISTLANGSTDEARALVIENTGSDAKNINDLQSKLASVWSNSTDKPKIEKAFAEIHPHKDFILKYVGPKEAAPIKELAPVEPAPKVVTMDAHSSAEGICNTEKMTGFSGTVESPKSDTIAIIGILALVSIVGLIGVIIAKQK